MRRLVPAPDAAPGATMFWPYVLLWIPMVVLAVANGVLRETTYGPRMAERRAHQVSTLLALILFGIYMWLVVRLQTPISIEHAMAVGLLWFSLTVAFEFLFGHYVARHPWQELFADWDLARGRLWPLVPVWVAIAPAVFHHLRS